jgi:ERCC4-type nuclease
MLVSPTEHAPQMRAIGTASYLTEKYGVDALWAVRGQWVGVQRKELSDLLASVGDGRLGRELAQMQHLVLKAVVIEGRPRFTTEGVLVTKGYGLEWTQAQYRGVLWSVMYRGVWVMHTDSIAETVEAIHLFQRWTQKTKHNSLDRRPGPVPLWGKVDNEDYARHLVMGLPGIGQETAARIIQKLGIPFCWRVTKEDLMTVEGIGKKKADQIWKCLEPDIDRSGNGR